MRTRRRQTNEASISFLDVISCGFGAVVLLLVVAELGDPAKRIELEQSIVTSFKLLQESLFEKRKENEQLTKLLQSSRSELEQVNRQTQKIQEKIESEVIPIPEIDESRPTVEDLKLMAMFYQEEKERLEGERIVTADNQVGGIPLDSEYIIFLIDSSGSMKQMKAAVDQQFRAILDTYPRVKGLQIVNNRGQYLYPETAGGWVEDTEARRKEILAKYVLWSSDIQSDPTEGLVAAVQTYSAQDKELCIFVLGDDYQTFADIGRLIEGIDKLQEKGPTGKPKIRIHGMGFPWLLKQMENFSDVRLYEQAVKYAALMRNLSSRSNGAFIGLNSIEPEGARR